MTPLLWLIVVGTFLLALGLVSLARPLLVRWGALDIPNHRSSHTVPVVRGGGIALTVSLVIALVMIFWLGSHLERSILVVVCLLTAVLASIVGVVEDVKGLLAMRRFWLQLAIGLAGTVVLVWLIGSDWWWVPFGALVTAAYINVANFMDGINGISGLHGLAVGGVYALIGHLSNELWLTVAGLLLAIVFTAFLPWNLFGGRMFLGDGGSYLLGCGIASLAVGAFLVGISPIALLGPVAIYITDVGSTLLRRIQAGEKWAEAHRSHIYQRLTDYGFSHSKTAFVVNSLGLGAGMAGLLALNPDPRGGITAIVIISVLVIAYVQMPKLVQRKAAGRAVREPAAQREERK